MLYLSAETGIFLTLDRGKSWRKLTGANFPNIRVDEITLHPRDNAMLVATHGRGIWILDHLEPIQEFDAGQGRRRPTRSCSRSARRCSGGSGTTATTSSGATSSAVGENPPTQAVIQLYFKKAADRREA